VSYFNVFFNGIAQKRIAFFGLDFTLLACTIQKKINAPFVAAATGNMMWKWIQQDANVGAYPPLGA